MTDNDQFSNEEPASDADLEIRAEYDWTETTPSIGVIETVAIASNRDPMALDPLYGTIDPDAINDLVGTGPPHANGSNVSVSFTHLGFDITVDAAGTVVVRDAQTVR